MKDKVKLKYKAIETRASGCLCPCNAGSCNGSSQMSWGYREANQLQKEQNTGYTNLLMQISASLLKNWRDKAHDIFLKSFGSD